MCGATRNVRFGSKADICAATSNVRFTPNSDRKSGHWRIYALAHPHPSLSPLFSLMVFANDPLPWPHKNQSCRTRLPASHRNARTGRRLRKAPLPSRGGAPAKAPSVIVPTCRLIRANCRRSFLLLSHVSNNRLCVLTALNPICEKS